MSAFERLDAAVSGRAPDRIPVSVWFHFGSEHLPPETVARLHAEFYRTYRWDFLKVMFDYRLDLPDAVDAGDGIDLEALLSETDWRAPFARQRTCLAILRADLGNEVPIVETVFSPWMYLLRHVGHDRRQYLLDRPDLVGAILDRLGAETCRHVDALKELAVYGVYFATIAGSAPVGSPEFALQAPRDRTVLDRAAGLIRFLHLHGASSRVDHLADYRREVLHRDYGPAGAADLARLRNEGEKAIMGGLPSDGLTRMSLAALRGQMAAAIDGAGQAGFILAPGCSVSPSLARRTMLALRDSPLLDTTRPRATATA